METLHEGSFRTSAGSCEEGCLETAVVGLGAIGDPLHRDRTALGHTARDQIVEQGAQRPREGLWVTSFPRATRCAGQARPYGIGGALRAGAAQRHANLPIAHKRRRVVARYSSARVPGVL